MGHARFVALCAVCACGAQSAAPHPVPSSPSSLPQSLSSMTAGVPSSSPPSHSPLEYPPAPRDDVEDAIHGVRVSDPYRWLEDDKSPRVARWADEQDALARRVLGGLAGRARIAARLKQLFYV
ncbi:MAG TPA: hypothetical protein VEK07_06180, partial [Polyangiaceae bacterium]|nr:hypothetical protein [Polyangiaceae bacterium]